MTPQRVSMITLGVADLDRAKAFYGALGWVPEQAIDSVVFYDLGGMKLGFFGLDPLAKDQGREGAALGVGAMALCQNFPDPGAVDAAFAQAEAAGATVLKRPEAVFWGGYSGYYADPDGHVWELAHNPFWPLDADGKFTQAPATE